MEGEKLIGIITERHYSRSMILKGKTSPTTLVKDIMDRSPRACLRSVPPCRGEFLEPGLEEPAMFKLPAYDPLVIAWLGFGILVITALAFVP